MKTLVTKSSVAVLITAVLLASVSSGAVFARETLWSGEAPSTVDSPAAAITWDLPWGLDADPASVNIWTCPEDAVQVALASVESSMPAGLLIWHYGGPVDGWQFYKKGWGAVNTLGTLTPGKGYIGVVPSASVWEIPQEPTPVDGVIIESLLVTADHCYLTAYSWGYKVGKKQEYNIECIVSDTGNELFYEWSCDGGEISGEGSTITWIAPGVSGEVTVTVMVTDVADNRVTESIILDVVSCSDCTFEC